jgi:hypothetical protein
VATSRPTAKWIMLRRCHSQAAKKWRSCCIAPVLQPQGFIDLDLAPASSSCRSFGAAGAISLHMRDGKRIIHKVMTGEAIDATSNVSGLSDNPYRIPEYTTSMKSLGKLDQIQVITHAHWDIATKLKCPLRVPLTIVDAHVRTEELPFAYFFEATLSEQMLKSSFQSTLQRYPILGGHLDVMDTCSIQCSPLDTVSLSFGSCNKTLADFLDRDDQKDMDSFSRGHQHYSSPGGHPLLMPIFDSLFIFDAKNKNKSAPLATVRVTQLRGGGTVLGLTLNHALGDAASCMRFVQCWGREMQHIAHPLSACYNRAQATCSGMLTSDMAEIILMGDDNASSTTRETSISQLKSFLPSWWPTTSDETPNSESGTQTTDPPDLGDRHEYVQLTFSPILLEAMKAHGMAECDNRQQGSTIEKDEECNINFRGTSSNSHFVSTNDMVTAFGWLMKRHLSQNLDWNISMVVNLRGRGDVQNFSAVNDAAGQAGLFGNGITSITACFLPSSLHFPVRDRENSSKDENVQQTPHEYNGKEGKRYTSLADVSAAASAIRTALIQGVADIPRRMALSRMGMKQHASYQGSSFSTTSWSSFPLWDISFSSKTKNKTLGEQKQNGGDRQTSWMKAPLVGFHGQPAYHLPPGRTFSSVIVPTLDGGCSYQLLVPSDKVQDAKEFHSRLCDMFRDWSHFRQEAKVI